MASKTNRSSIFMVVLAPILLLLCFFVPEGSAHSLTDDEGNQIVFAKPFSRIISLYPAHTENLIDLGAADLLMGITTENSVPREVTDKARFHYRDSAEKFLGAAPDLILIRPMISRSQPELISKLRMVGITVVSLQPTSVDQMYDYWRKLGLLTGMEHNATQMIATFKAGLETLQRNIPLEIAHRPRVYFEAIHAKMKTFSPTAISIFALEAAGGVNIAADATARNNSNIAPYGKERILSRGPQIDVFLSQVGRMNRVTGEDIYDEPGFQLIKAIQTKSVFLVEEEIVSRPTMRLLQGIEQIQSFLYPADAIAHTRPKPDEPSLNQ